jgi:short-subunit dehydrogenase
MKTMAEYHKLVADHFKDMDIGYVALNAGCGSGGKLFTETADDAVENIMFLNGFHVIFLARALLDKLLSRPTRSAIVITSSIHSYLSTPLSSTYAGTKALERIFGQALHYETRHKIDLLVYTPGFVDTKLLDRVKKQGSVFLMVQP